MDLANLVPSLQRALAAPGEFDTFFPDSTPDDLAGTLADGLAEAQLDGFLSAISLNVTDNSTDLDLAVPQQALVILYSAARVLAARVSNLKNRTHYKANGVEADSEQSASVLVELLRETAARKKQLLDDARTGRAATFFSMTDLYVAKSLDIRPQEADYISMPELGFLSPAEPRF